MAFTAWGRTYYVNTSGDDRNDGSRRHPWQTLARVSAQHFRAGDSVLFAPGQVFQGTLRINAARRVVIGVYGGGRGAANGSGAANGASAAAPFATIDAGDSSAIVLYQAAHLTLSRLHLVGAGRKTGNVKEGLSMVDCAYVNVHDLDITGFQKAGLIIYASTDIDVTHVSAHENGSAGIAVEGDFSNKITSRRIRIVECRTEDNPGDPTNLTNHSGNGIVVGHCTNLLIDRCTATNNGWDMPRIGNGPVGIWCYEADSVVIQHCLAYGNKTSPGAADGGGFDLDGGVTNSVIQYCFSYGNQGSGYCIFQYWGASPWYHNVIRYNISENDGTVSDSRAGIYVWNSSDDEKQFYDCEVYGNIIYNDQVAAISFSEKSENKDFRFHHNVFVGRDSLIKGRDRLGGCVFLYNDWWSILSGFNAGGYRDIKTWSEETGKEQKDGRLVGLNLQPDFLRPGKATFTRASQLHAFTNYSLPLHSRLRQQPVFTNLHGIKYATQKLY